MGKGFTNPILNNLMAGGAGQGAGPVLRFPRPGDGLRLLEGGGGGRQRAGRHGVHEVGNNNNKVN